MNNQKELLEAEQNHPPYYQCQSGEIVYIAQSPEDYNAAQARIKELEQRVSELEDAIKDLWANEAQLLRLLEKWAGLTVANADDLPEIMRDTRRKIAAK